MKRFKLRNPFLILIEPVESFIEYIEIDKDVASIKFHSNKTIYHYDIVDYVKKLLLTPSPEYSVGKVYNVWLRPNGAFAKTVFKEYEEESATTAE